MSDSTDKYADTLKELLCFVMDVAADPSVPADLRVKGTNLVGQFLLATMQSIAGRKGDKTAVEDLPTGRPAEDHGFGAGEPRPTSSAVDHTLRQAQDIYRAEAQRNPAQYKHRGEE